MMKELLFETFQEGEYFLGAICWICFLILIGIALLFSQFLLDEYRWGQVEEFPHKAKLVSLSTLDSTLQTTSVPIVNPNGGVGIGLVTTGSPASSTTVWDCGEFGRLKTDDEKVFRYAKPESILILKKMGDRARIVGIKREGQ